jgi:AraC-like DNA-binding protein
VTGKTARTVKTSDEIKSAVVLRDAGYSLASISSKTNISPSTLQRHFRKLSTSKGALSSKAVYDARQELLNDGGFISDLKRQISASLLDDLQQAQDIRASIAITLYDLMQDTSTPATYKARAIAALATGLTLTQKMMRVTLAMDDQPVQQDELPSLLISELTQADIDDMRRHQLELSGLDDPTSYNDFDDVVIEE